MAITPWQLYWITRLDYIKGTLLFVGILIGLIGLIGTLIIIIDYIDGKNFKFSLGLWFILITDVIFISLAGFIPTTKEMCIILVLPKIVNNQQVQEIPNKVLNLSNEWLEELKPKKEK